MDLNNNNEDKSISDILFGEIPLSQQDHITEDASPHNHNYNIRQKLKFSPYSQINKLYKTQDFKSSSSNEFSDIKNALNNNNHIQNSTSRVQRSLTPGRSGERYGIMGSNKTNDELQEIIEKIHCPIDDLSLTSFTNSSSAQRLQESRRRLQSDNSDNKLNQNDQQQQDQIQIQLQNVHISRHMVDLNLQQIKQNSKKNGNQNNQKKRIDSQKSIDFDDYENKENQFDYGNFQQTNTTNCQLEQTQKQYLNLSAIKSQQNLVTNRSIHNNSQHHPQQPQKSSQLLQKQQQSTVRDSIELEQRMKEWTEQHVENTNNNNSQKYQNGKQQQDMEELNEDLENTDGKTDNKYMFPKIIAPSIEISHENSLGIWKSGSSRYKQLQQSNKKRVSDLELNEDEQIDENEISYQLPTTIKQKQQRLNFQTFGDKNTQNSYQILNTEDNLDKNNKNEENNNFNNNNEEEDNVLSNLDKYFDAAQTNNCTPQQQQKHEKKEDNHNNNNNNNSNINQNNPIINIQQNQSRQYYQQQIQQSYSKLSHISYTNGNTTNNVSQFNPNENQENLEYERLVEDNKDLLALTCNLQGLVERQEQDYQFLEQRNLELQEHIQFLQCKFQESDSSMTLETYRGRRLQQEVQNNEKLKKEVQDYRQKLREYQNQTQDLNQTVVQEGVVKEQMGIKICELEGVVEKLQGQLESEIQQMQKIQDALEEENSNLREILNEKDQVQAEQVATFELREKILNDELNQLKISQERQLYSLKEEKSQLQKQLQDQQFQSLQQQYNTTNSTKDTLMTTGEPQNTSQKQLCNCRDNVQKLLEQLDCKRYDLKSYDVEECCQELKARFQKQKHEFEDQEQQVKTLLVEQKNMEGEIEEYQKSQKNQKKKMEELVQFSLKNQGDNFEQERRGLRGQIEGFQKNLSQIQGQIREKEQKIREIQDEKTGYSKKLVEYQDVIQNIEKEKNTLIEYNEKLLKNNDQVLCDNSNLQVHNNKLSLENEQLQAQNCQILEENQGLKEEHQEILMENQMLRENNQPQITQKEFKKYQKQNQEFQQKLKELEKKYMEILQKNKESQKIMQKLENEKNELEKELQQKKKTLNCKIQELKNQIQNSKNSSEKTLEMTDKMKTLNTRILDLEKQVSTQQKMKRSESSQQIIQSQNNNNKRTTRDLSVQSRKEAQLNQSPGEKAFQEKFQSICTEFLEQNAEFQKLKQVFIQRVQSLQEKCRDFELKNKKLEEKLEEKGLNKRQNNHIPKQFDQNDLKDDVGGDQFSIVELFSPEMLSNEETLRLMSEILQKVVNSKEMKTYLQKQGDFHKLVELIQGNEETKQKQNQPSNMQQTLRGTKSTSNLSRECANLYNQQQQLHQQINKQQNLNFQKKNQSMNQFNVCPQVQYNINQNIQNNNNNFRGNSGVSQCTNNANNNNSLQKQLKMNSELDQIKKQLFASSGNNSKSNTIGGNLNLQGQKQKMQKQTMSQKNFKFGSLDSYRNNLYSTQPKIKK